MSKALEKKPLYWSVATGWVYEDNTSQERVDETAKDRLDREEIIRMAREAGLAYGSDEKPLGSVTRFAALVAAAEREACALLCKTMGAEGYGWVSITEAIRART